MARIQLLSALLLSGLCMSLFSQEFTVQALEDSTSKTLAGMPITLRYDCGRTLPFHCKWITRKTGPDGLAHFPEAGSLLDVDDIYSLPVAYGVTCCDIQPKSFPGTGTMRFRRRSFSEMMEFIFRGP